jgi:tRNA threonylcarbamoyl adenosine modification protein YeaZ
VSDEWRLGIESSAGKAAVALCRGRELVAEEALPAAFNHSAVMMGPLTSVLDALPGGEELSGVLVGTGPGSYNGARVGIAAGQGVAVFHGCPVLGICSLEAVAPVREGESCLAVGDARRGTFFAIPLVGGRIAGRVELLDRASWLARLDAWKDLLLTLEEPGRLKLPPRLATRVELVAPEASLLVAAWDGKDEEERTRLAAVAPEPFYLREPYVTSDAVVDGPA